MKRRVLLQITAAVAALVSIPAIALAASSSNLTQTINDTGTLAADVVNASRVPVASPAVALNAQSFSFDCQTSSSSQFGTSNERLHVTNGGAADSGWTLALAATGGETSTWSDGTNTFDYNDPAGSGCTNGQLTVNPSAATLSTDACAGCTTSNVSVGTSAAFSQGVIPSVTLINAGAASDDIWRGYLTGVSVSQAIPGAQEPGDYTLNLTLTATAQ